MFEINHGPDTAIARRRHMLRCNTLGLACAVWSQTVEALDAGEAELPRHGPTLTALAMLVGEPRPAWLPVVGGRLHAAIGGDDTATPVVALRLADVWAPYFARAMATVVNSLAAEGPPRAVSGLVMHVNGEPVVHAHDMHSTLPQASYEAAYRQLAMRAVQVVEQWWREAQTGA